MGVSKLAKQIVPAGLFEKVVPYWHLSKAMFYQTSAGFPANSMTVIGVTGTDGKTTTSTLITQMLRNSGRKVAMMTTISTDYGDGVGPQPNASRLTTFSARDIAAALQRMESSGVEYLVLEVTSHALAQHRIWGVSIDIAVMTNIGHEHLDYHKTFENYRDAKLRLFKIANKSKNSRHTGIINAEDPSASLFAKNVQRAITYGKGDTASMRAHSVNLTPNGSTYIASISDSDYAITCFLPGSFNIYNSLAAVSVGHELGLTKEEIEQGIASLKQVEGRMTRVDEGQDFTVIVDYAHTPESFDKLFAELRSLTRGKMICVFGSAGRRDEAKRARQGAIAGKWCHLVIVTEEDDRDIDRDEILRQIAGGAEQSGKVVGEDVLIVGQREEAVQTAIDAAQPDDMVVLLGKGHEKSILYNGPQAAALRHLPQDDNDERRVLKRPYDEVAVVRQAINNKMRADP